jgi:predicted O-methyltransferase YrrM
MEPQLLELLDELARFGDENDERHTERSQRMLNITPDTGRLLWTLVRSARARQILEIGTSNAYSTIWLADAAAAHGGHVVTLEQDAAKIELARQNLGRAKRAEVVEIRHGRALELLQGLAGPFDFVFLDADRASYLQYLELVLPRVALGGLIVADNVVSHATELAAYLQRVKSEPRLFSVTVPIGKGEEVSIRVG